MEKKAGLYIVSTPIGNLDDITLRAINILKNSDVICCEDTRILNKLLSKLNISGKKIEVYNDHSSEYNREKIANYIKAGLMVALVSDAGTPIISDPGYKLVNSIYDEELHVDAIPGPCAAINALVLSGMPSDRFTFLGFLPKGKIHKEKRLEHISKIPNTIIFYEASQRIIETIQMIYNSFENFEIAIIKEMTKIHQTVLKSNRDNILEDIKNLNLKGEFVILVKNLNITNQFSEKELHEYISHNLLNGMSARNIADNLIKDELTNYSKNEIYKLIESVKNQQN